MLHVLRPSPCGQHLTNGVGPNTVHPTGCDVNKDIEIDGITQLTLPSMQMPLVEKALRAYVKVIWDKAYLRTEKFLSPNKPIRED